MRKRSGNNNLHTGAFRQNRARQIIGFLLAFSPLDYDEEIVMVIYQLSFEVKGLSLIHI